MNFNKQKELEKNVEVYIDMIDGKPHVHIQVDTPDASMNPVLSLDTYKLYFDEEFRQFILNNPENNNE